MEEIGLVHGLGGLLYHCKTVAENLEDCANLSYSFKLFSSWSRP